MSHSTLTVVLPGTLTVGEIPAALSAALAPFDENKETPRYVEHTKAELIDMKRAEIARTRDGNYAEFLADPAAYAEKVHNIRHLEWISGGTAKAREVCPKRWEELLLGFKEEARSYHNAVGHRLGEAVEQHMEVPFDESFPAQLEWDDERVHQEATRWHEDIGPEGEVYSTYNPNSKWDWYVIGGRWGDYWKVTDAQAAHLGEAAWRRRPTLSLGEADSRYVAEMEARPGPRSDVARKCDIDFEEDGLFPATFAFLEKDGTWHEKGDMGWFGMVAHEKAQEDWNAQYAVLLETVDPLDWLVLVDVHI